MTCRCIGGFNIARNRIFSWKKGEGEHVESGEPLKPVVLSNRNTVKKDCNCQNTSGEWVREADLKINYSAPLFITSQRRGPLAIRGEFIDIIQSHLLDTKMICEYCSGRSFEQPSLFWICPKSVEIWLVERFKWSTVSTLLKTLITDSAWRKTNESPFQSPQDVDTADIYLFR